MLFFLVCQGFNGVADWLWVENRRGDSLGGSCFKPNQQHDSLGVLLLILMQCLGCGTGLV